MSFPVVPVPKSSCRERVPRLKRAQSSRSSFLLSWATSATRLRTSMVGVVVFGFTVMRGIMSLVRDTCMAIPIRIWSDFV